MNFARPQGLLRPHMGLRSHSCQRGRHGRPARQHPRAQSCPRGRPRGLASERRKHELLSQSHPRNTNPASTSHPTQLPIPTHSIPRTSTSQQATAAAVAAAASAALAHAHAPAAAAAAAAATAAAAAAAAASAASNRSCYAGWSREALAMPQGPPAAWRSSPPSPRACRACSVAPRQAQRTRHKKLKLAPQMVALGWSLHRLYRPYGCPVM